MVIPLTDSVRAGRRAWVNLGLIAASVAVFLWELSAPEEALGRLAMVPVRVFALPWDPDPGVALTLLTAMFLHGGWLHLLGNMVFLWVFGDNVEDRLGHGRYLAFYLLGGLVGNLAHVLANPTSPVPTIGASGAVAAVLGGYAVSYPKARVLALVPVGFLVPVLRLPAWLLLGLWFALQLWGGLVTPGTAPIAFWAHIGGFLAGMGLVRLMAPEGAGAGAG